MDRVASPATLQTGSTNSEWATKEDQALDEALKNDILPGNRLLRDDLEAQIEAFIDTMITFGSANA